MPRQQVAFREKAREIKDCGDLKEDFYTRFKTDFNGFWVVTWREKMSLKMTQHDMKLIKYKRQIRGVGGRLGVAFLHKRK